MVVFVVVVIGLDRRSKNQETDEQPPGYNLTKLVHVFIVPKNLVRIAGVGKRSTPTF
jgi:hypothetical protein